MEQVRIGVFGAARGMTMIREMLNNPEARVVAVCDKYQPLLEQCRSLAEEKGVQVDFYTDFERFFEHDMDAVVLANYAHEHVPYAVRLLHSGRHVMSEVITCATLAEAVELIETVEETGRIYHFAENCCYFNTTTEMRRLYRQGDIGELMQGEGEYIHDCSSIWPQITYGERNHWRNRMSSVFYCTHSLGPVLYATGLRPVKVNGFETRNMPFMRRLGASAGTAGTLMVTLENGAIVKSIDMCLKRPHALNFKLYGDKGMMETDHWQQNLLHMYREGERNCVGACEHYVPEFTMEKAKKSAHWGGDFFTSYYFVRAILGDAEAKANLIDVYSAVDMCIPGILGYRSIVEGNRAVDIPDLRIASERDRVRHDTFCTFREIAGDMYVPNNAMQANRDVPIDDAVYEEVRRRWEHGEPG